MCEIVPWSSIADTYTDCLVLGNGASIAIHNGFNYGSLLQSARDAGLITPPIEEIFAHLSTTDFELVMQMLWHAYHINSALDVDGDAIEHAYLDIRRALIDTVRGFHPEYSDVVSDVRVIARFLRQFKTVASLNYDLLVYWAMMVGNAEVGRWFKDGFTEDDRSFDRDWERLRNPLGAEGSTLVVYPHGNLAISSQLTGPDRKIDAGAAGDLLNTIEEAWSEKLLAIRRSDYLSRVYDDVLRQAGDSLAVYGWSMKDNDLHILKRLSQAGLARVAVSVRAKGKDENELKETCDAFRRRIRLGMRRSLKIEFFDAEGSGVWNHE